MYDIRDQRLGSSKAVHNYEMLLVSAVVFEPNNLYGNLLIPPRKQLLHKSDLCTYIID